MSEFGLKIFCASSSNEFSEMVVDEGFKVSNVTVVYILKKLLVPNKLFFTPKFSPNFVLRLCVRIFGMWAQNLV